MHKIQIRSMRSEQDVLKSLSVAAVGGLRRIHTFTHELIPPSGPKLQNHDFGDMTQSNGPFVKWTS